MSPHPTSWRSILILSFHQRLRLPSGLFTSCFPTKTLYTPLLFPIHATFPVHLIFLDLITRTTFGEEYRSLGSLLCNFLYYIFIIILSSTEQSSSWHADSPSASQKIPRILCNSKVRYRTDNSPPPVPILSLSIQSTLNVPFLEDPF